MTSTSTYLVGNIAVEGAMTLRSRQVTADDLSGRSQVSVLTFDSANDGQLYGFAYDGLTAIQVAGSGDALADTAAFKVAWDASGELGPLGTLVDNLDGSATVTFSDDRKHVLSAVSAGASAVSEEVFTRSVNAGILMIDKFTSAVRLRLDADLVVHGISVQDEGLDVTEFSADRFITIYCATDAGAVLVGESAAAIDDPADRFKIVGSNAALVGVDQREIQVTYDGAAQRWKVPDWNGGNAHAYTSDGATHETLEVFGTVGEGQVWTVTAEVSAHANDGLAGSVMQLRGIGRRASGGGSLIVDSSLLSTGNLAGDTCRLFANGNGLELQMLTTYVGDVDVKWTRRVVRLP